MEIRTFAPGELIIVQDAEPDEFFIITSGEAKVYLIEPPGTYEIYMDTIHAGQYFGEVALIHGGKRTATVRAATPVEAIALRQQAFLDLIEQSDETRAELERVAGERKQILIETRSGI